MSEKETVKKEKKHRIKNFLKSRKTKHGAIATAIIAIAVVLVLLVNILANMLVDKYPSLQLDFTASKIYQLQEDTENYIKQLNKDITVYILADKDTFLNGLGGVDDANIFKQAEMLLTKADALSDKLTVEYINLSENPTFSSKYPNVNWNSYTETYLMLVDAGESYDVRTLNDCFTYDSQMSSQYGAYYWTETKIEQALATGIVNATATEKVKVQLLTGSGQQEGYYTDIQQLLEGNAYTTEEVDITTSELADDAQIAVLFGPSVDFSENATERLESWLENDGKYGRTLIYLPLDQKVDTPNLDGLLGKYGMKLSDGLVFSNNKDNVIYELNTSFAYYANYPEDSEYTASLKNQGVKTACAYSKNIEITDSSIATALLTAEGSMGILPYEEIENANKGEDIDQQKYINENGVNLAVIGSKSADESGAKSNVAVFGSYYFMSSAFLSNASFNNANYFVNLCNTVADKEDAGITITSATQDSQTLTIKNIGQVYAVYIIFIFIIPLLVVAMGIVMFIRRRNR